MDKNKVVHAYGVVTSQSTVHGRAVPQGYLPVNVTAVLPGCNLSPTAENPFGEEIVAKGGFLNLAYEEISSNC